MKKYVLRRLLQLIPILLAITFLSFGMMRIAGSDVVEQKIENTGSDISQEVVDAAREELGLDKPFLTQYVVWLGGLLHGDMGTSYVSGKPVFSTFISKLPATLLLTAVSILLTILISIPLGILSAIHQNRFSDYLIRILSFIGNSLPNFFVSLLLMYLFAIRLGWFPVMATGIGFKSVAMPGYYTGHCHECKICTTGKGCRFRGIKSGLCHRCKSKRCQIFHHFMGKRDESLPGNDYYVTDVVSWKPFRWYGHCRIDLYVGWGGKDGGGCYQYERLSHHSGVCYVDGHHLCGSQSSDRYFLSFPGSQDSSGR